METLPVRRLVKLMILARPAPPSPWLAPGAEMVHSVRILPTFVRSSRRKVPPRNPAGLRDGSPETAERWWDDLSQCLQLLCAKVGFSFGAASHMRVPLASEREWPPGGPNDATAEYLPNSQTHGRMRKNARCTLLGNSFPVRHADYVLWCVLWQNGIRPFGPDVEVLLEARTRQEAACLRTQDRATDGGGTPNLCVRLALVLCRRAFRAGDLRSHPGRPKGIRSAPRAALFPGLWTWVTVISGRWADVNRRLNGYTLQAFSRHLATRASSPLHVRCRVCHLLDDQVFIVFLSMSRLSSPLLGQLVALPHWAAPRTTLSLSVIRSSNVHGRRLLQVAKNS